MLCLVTCNTFVAPRKAYFENLYEKFSAILAISPQDVP